jgi:hypothetical protein
MDDSNPNNQHNHFGASQAQELPKTASGDNDEKEQEDIGEPISIEEMKLKHQLYGVQRQQLQQQLLQHNFQFLLNNNHNTSTSFNNNNNNNNNNFNSIQQGLFSSPYLQTNNNMMMMMPSDNNTHAMLSQRRFNPLATTVRIQQQQQQQLDYQPQPQHHNIMNNSVQNSIHQLQQLEYQKQQLEFQLQHQQQQQQQLQRQQLEFQLQQQQQHMAMLSWSQQGVTTTSSSFGSNNVVIPNAATVAAPTNVMSQHQPPAQPPQQLASMLPTAASTKRMIDPSTTTTTTTTMMQGQQQQQQQQEQDYHATTAGIDGNVNGMDSTNNTPMLFVPIPAPSSSTVVGAPAPIAKLPSSSSTDNITTATTHCQQPNQSYLGGIPHLGKIPHLNITSSFVSAADQSTSLFGSSPPACQTIDPTSQVRIPSASPSSTTQNTTRTGLLPTLVNPVGNTPVSYSNFRSPSSARVSSSGLGKKQQMEQEKEDPKSNNSASSYAVVRPLSAYNYFFTEERDKMLHGEGKYGDESHEERKKRLLSMHLSKDRNKRRPHRKTHGKISFTTLSQQIGQRWRQLTNEEKDFYKSVAAADVARYKEESIKFEEKDKIFRGRDEK